VDSRDNNKSLLHEDFQPILRHAKRVLRTGNSNTRSDGEDTEDAEVTEQQIEMDSILLKREILDAVLRGMTFF
jgi:hypothetical protein